MVDAGCFSIMCEVTTEEVCQFLTETLPVPVVSLGAGNKAHGVHIISSDLFHLYEEHTPRHSKIYTDLIPIIEDVYTRYMTDVRARTYPGPEHTAYMAPKELEQFAAKVGWTTPPIEAAEQREKGKRKPAQSAA
jgi:3-methyl-2-oxobutanoate hydroxymethyltransferase